MIKHDLADLFRKNSVHKKFVINYDGGTITNSDLLMEEFSLEESICSEEELRFGSCEASVIKFPISNVFTSLNGKVLDVSVVLDHNEDKPLKIGKYKVDSDIPTADRKRKDITAYDALYDVINADVAEWYNALLPNADSTVTLKQFRDSFFGYFGIEQVEVTLINDSMIVTKTIQPTELSGSVVANAICELNGCFGHINRDGLMDYVFLKGFTESVYPSDDLYPADDLFPSEANYHKYTKSDYSSGGCDYQEYVVRKITGLEIRQEEDSAGVFVGEKENPYVVSDNFLIYGKSTEEMTTIAQNMLNVINGIEYRPFTLNTFRGNPCVEVGDGIKIYADNQIIESYVLNRTLTGIQALSDSFETNGKEYRTAQVNSVQSQITQLKGKTNRIERTVEETRSEIEDMEQGLSSRITQTSNSIASEVSRATGAEKDLASNINQTAESIETEVVRAKGAENELSSRITQTANSISSKVSKGEVISEINQSAETVKIKASKISLEGTVTANGNVTIGTDGKLTAKNGSFEGDVKIKDGLWLWFEDVYGSVEGSKFYEAATITMISEAPYLKTLPISASEVWATYLNANNAYFDTVSASEGISGKIKCTDDKNRHPIGTTDSDAGYQIAYINSKAPNSAGNYYITLMARWEGVGYSAHNIVSASSDIRLKENINPTKVKNALDVINKFKLREFEWKESGAHQKIGFIADELQEVDERLAVGGGYEEDGTPNYKTVDSFYMQGYIVKAIQELSAENKELKSEIDELKKSVSFLMEKLGGMENE